MLNIKISELFSHIMFHSTSCKSHGLYNGKRYLSSCSHADADNIFFGQLTSMGWLTLGIEISEEALLEFASTQVTLVIR